MRPCIVRSGFMRKPTSCKFTAKMRRNGVQTTHCTWCWREQPTPPREETAS